MNGIATTPKWWSDKITAEWRAGVSGMLEAIFACGRDLIAARDALEDRSFLAMIESKLPFQKSTAYYLMDIAGDLRLTDFRTCGILPPYVKTLELLSRLDDEVLDLLIARGVIRQDMTSGDLMMALRALKAERNRADFVRAPTGKYRILLADPPWRYDNNQPAYFGDQRDHYATMDLEEVAAFEIGGKPVVEFAEESAVLFLWITSPILAEFKPILDAWGFTYKASFIWDKVGHVMGHYNSVRHEILLLATRGSCPIDCAKLIDSVVSIERTEHSVKPAEFYDIIEGLYTWGRKLELFQRTPRKGWDGLDTRLRRRRNERSARSVASCRGKWRSLANQAPRFGTAWSARFS